MIRQAILFKENNQELNIRKTKKSFTLKISKKAQRDEDFNGNKNYF